MKEFKVSVIIPVYNAEQFVEKAIRSAHELEEVAEIIVVEDKSPDNCLEICRNLQDQLPKVKLFQHPDQQNHGGSASRNLGIKMATQPYIAFLDADDYYLSNRFLTDKEILENQEVDGVYNAIGIHYYTQTGKDNFINAGFQYQELTTLSGKASPDELFSVLVGYHPKIKGAFHTDTITVKKEVYEKIGDFNVNLEMQEDPHLWIRMAAFCNLVPGEINKPVAIRGVHDENRMVNIKHQRICRKAMWIDLNKVIVKSGFAIQHPAKYKAFQRVYLRTVIENSNRYKALLYLIRFILVDKNIVIKNTYFFDHTFLYIFGRNYFTLHLISFKNRFSKS